MPLSSTLSNWRTLTRTVDKIKPDASFIRNLVFPGQGQTFSTPEVRFDVIEGGREVSPFVRRGGEAVRIRGYGHKRRVIETPNIKLKMEIDPEAYAQSAAPGTIQELLSGDSSMEASVRAQVARDLTRLKRMGGNTVEWMCCRALDGTLSYAGSEGTDSWEIVYSTRSGYDTTWVKTASIIEKTRAVKHAMNKEGFNPTVVVMGEAAAARVIGHDEWKTTYNQALASRLAANEVSVSLTSPIGANGAVAEGMFGQLPWYTYTYEVTPWGGSSEALIPTNNIYFIDTSPSSENEIYYGGIYDVKTMNKTFALREFSKSWEQDDPSLAFMLYQTRPLPVLRKPYSILKVVTSDT